MPDFGLYYIGDGSAIVGIPARDLTAEEVKEYGGEAYLLMTGLYALPETASKKTAKTGGKE
jgi:hypothetical protein